MKKILTLMAIALATLTSCNEKEKVEKEYIMLEHLWDYEYADDEWYGGYVDAFGDTEKSVYIAAWGEIYGQYAYGLQESDWIVSCDENWCHYEYSGTSLLKLNFSCDDNTTGENRRATIIVSVKDQSIEIEIEQLGIPSVTISTPGTLTQELVDKDLLYATSLKISGELNDKDLETIKGLKDVEILDLTDAVIDDLPDEMFYRNETVKNIRLPRSITTIHSKTFTYSSLEYVYFPANILKIEDGVFNDYNDYYDYATGAFSEAPLREIEFESNSKLEYIGDGTFTGCGIRSSYQTVGGDTRYYSELNITMPASVEHIGSYVFGNTPNFYADVNLEFENNSKLRYFVSNRLTPY